MTNRYPLIVNPSTNQIQEIPFGDVLNLDGNAVNQINVSGVTTSVGGFVGNLTGTATTATNVIGGIGSITSLSVSGVSTLGTIQVSSGIVTATSGIVTYYGDGSKLQNIILGVGIQSTGTVVGTGITTLNFIGVGNTFSVDGSTVNISIQGGGGGESYWVQSTLGIHTTSNVGIATTNPIQPLQVGSAGTSVVVVTGIGSVGIGTTNPNTKLHVLGDINLDDGGSFITTLQCVTPTANRTISFPDRTGTIALIAGSSGQFIYNNAGAYAGLSALTTDGTNVTLTGRFISSLNGAASAPPGTFTGTWFTGGTSTTTKPQVLIEPTGATSTAWSTSGTGLGVNAASGFAGNLLDLQVNGTSQFSISGLFATLGTPGSGGGIVFRGSATANGFYGVRYEVPSDSLALVGHNRAVTIGLGGASNTTYTPIYYFGTGGNIPTSGNTTTLNVPSNTFEARNGASPMTWRIYNTHTSSTNFERGRLQWSSNVLLIGTEKGADGGTARAVELQTDSISRLALDTTGSVRVVTALTVATLPGTPAVGMVARVTDALAPAVGSTVAGGGAAAALVWYNGANWSVIGV